MVKENEKLTNNGTKLNLNASDVLKMDLNEVINLENERINNIGNGNR